MRPLALVLVLLSSAGTVAAQGDDTAVTLTASDIGDATATLTISGHTDGWWYRGQDSGTSQWGTCTAVAAGTTAVGISGLTAATPYDYTAYSDNTCNTKLAEVEFRTLAPTVSVSDVQQDEDETWMTFEVSLSAPSRDMVTVDVYTSDGTATRNTDYRSVSEKLVFRPNSRHPTRPVVVLVYDDQDLEPDETFTVTLTNPTGATLGDATATGTIKNDGDTAAKLAASDIGDTTATLTISGHTDSWWYRARDTGTSQWGTCTAVAAGTTAVGISGLTAVKSYEYTAYSDSTCTTKLATVEFRTIAPLGTPTVSVSDVQGSEDETWMTFEVSLSAPSRDTVTVEVQTSDGTATSGTDYRSVSRTLTFPPNSTDPQHANVLVYDDQDLEPDETFTVTLTNPTGATLGDATATGTIRNDDTAAKLAASDIGDTTATLTISGHTGSWWYRARDTGTSKWGTCTAVAAGTTAVGISGLTAVRTYEYTAYSDSTCTTKLATVEFRTIAPEGTPTVSVSDEREYEDETWVTFLVSLSAPSRDTVTVDVETSDGTATSGTDYRSVSRTLTFSPNSRSPQHVPVLVYDDQDLEPDETFTVTLTNPTGATLGDATATGTIRNDEPMPVSGMMASNPTATAVDLSWTLPAQPRGVTVRAVGVQRQEADGAWSAEATLAADAASHTVTGLNAGTAYSFRTRLATNKGNADSEPVSATTRAAEPATVLTASFHDVPSEHGGKDSEFSFELRFSEDLVRQLSSATLRDEALEATNATVTRAKRVVKRENRLWTITVRPDSAQAVTVSLPATTDCAAAGALCTPDGRPLSNATTATVSGPANRPATGAPVITGEARVGGTLEASTGDIEDADGLSGAAFAFQWLSGDAEIAGATDASYTLADSDEGSSIKVRVTFTDDAGHEETLTSAATETVAPPLPPLTASFHDVPSEHGGQGSEFSFELRFSEDFGGRLPYKKLRDEALTATNGRVRGAKRVAQNQNQRWTITVRAHSSEAVSVSLAATTDCAAAAAICTPDGRPLSNAVSATVEGPPLEPLTAAFEGVPGEHDGSTFTFRVQFSADAEVTPRVLRETAFDVTGGRVRRAPRVDGRDDLREIHIQPSGSGAVSVTLPATTNCDAAGAICTSDGRPLSNSNSATVAGPVGVSVADARVEEGAGAVLAFAVTLSRAATSAFSVDYATSDGSARAGEDYTAASGTLSFQAGESSRTIEVAVLDDAHDEGEETLTLRLSNASGGQVTDGEATGTIENTDLMPAALLARIGRATAEQVVEHIEERMAAPRKRGFRARFAGRELQPGSERDFALGFLSSFAPMGTGMADAAPMGGAAPMAMGPHAPGRGTFGAGPAGMRGTMGMGGAMGMAGVGGTAGAMGMGLVGPAPMGGASAMAGYGPADGRHGGGLFGSMGMGGGVFSDSELELNRESRGGVLSVWSRSSRSYFSGMEDALSLDGDVRTTMVGADYSRGALTVGLSVGRTLGLGGYSGPSGGRMSTSMTGFYPWAGYQLNDRVSVWGVTGWGTGALSLTPDGASALQTGVSMAMSAVGTRGELIGSRATGGFALAFKADAMWVGAASDLLDGAAGRLNASEAGVTRVRTALEGSRGFTIGGRLSLRPSVEVGLRRDGGDAETGAGMDVGGGLVFTDTVTGLSLDVRVRTLVVHQAEGFTERGMSLSFGWDPTPSSPLGLTAKVAPSWGGSAQGGAEALWGGQMVYGMGSHRLYGSGDRVDAELGYGLPVGARFVGTPRVGLATSQYGRDYRVGYGLGVLDRGNVNFELGVDAQRRESPMQGEASNGFLGRATLGW